jgi:hypothetical protein
MTLHDPLLAGQAGSGKTILRLRAARALFVLSDLGTKVPESLTERSRKMLQHNRRKWIILSVALLIGLAITSVAISMASQPAFAGQPPAGEAKDQAEAYVVLSWNDLGMHCYNNDFQDLGVLPPYNTLWAQVVKRGDPPEIVTSGISVTYVFTDNTYSVGKTNFWEYDQALFGVDLPPNVGLTGKGLSGGMDLQGDHFIAEGIPLTEFRDSAPDTPYPYQMATIVVHETGTGAELARAIVVAPVSTEMRCDLCHHDGGVEDISTGRVGTNILTLHDMENAEEYPPGHTGLLMNRRPVLCAECHASNALAAPGVSGVPNLSKAMHEAHHFIDETKPGLEGCYSCHPGPQTRCLRGVMSQDFGMICNDCHGSMQQVSQNPSPWLHEPRCDNAACHGSGYQQNQALYRMSQEHGDVYCEACHDSTHAIAPSREPNDAIKFIGWQGHAGPLDTCTVCHLTTPDGPGPHGISAVPELSIHLYLPVLLRE